MSIIGYIRFSTKQIVSVLIILSLACLLFQFGTTAEGAPVTTIYEAENGNLNGSAVVASKSIMSGGKYVRNIGNNSSNWVQITVNASSSGNAAMAIRYVSGGERTMYWSVNGGSGSSATMNSGDWNTLATHNTTVSLNSGSNTIRFYNNSAYAPDLDRISITVDSVQQDPPTVGWTQMPFNYYIQKPWNLNLSDRYKYDAATNTHTMWIYSTDQPFQQGNTTDPRTEMRWNEEYSTGEHMWEADVYIASGSVGSSVMQILRISRPAGTPATDIMLVAHADNTVRRYFDGNGALIKSNVYDNWWNLKVAHNANTGTIKVYADDQLVLTVADRGPATRHFKNGVYGVDGRSETKFRDIKYWVK